MILQLFLDASIKEVEVEMAALDEYQNLLAKTDNLFIKLDVEGFEIEVLRGATELLKTIE